MIQSHLLTGIYQVAGPLGLPDVGSSSVLLRVTESRGTSMHGPLIHPFVNLFVCSFNEWIVRTSSVLRKKTTQIGRWPSV